MSIAVRWDRRYCHFSSLSILPDQWSPHPLCHKMLHSSVACKIDINQMMHIKNHDFVVVYALLMYNKKIWTCNPTVKLRRSIVFFPVTSVIGISTLTFAFPLLPALLPEKFLGNNISKCHSLHNSWNTSFKKEISSVNSFFPYQQASHLQKHEGHGQGIQCEEQVDHRHYLHKQCFKTNWKRLTWARRNSN